MGERIEQRITQLKEIVESTNERLTAEMKAADVRWDSVKILWRRLDALERNVKEMAKREMTATTTPGYCPTCEHYSCVCPQCKRPL
jgi:hypothetical protein